MSKMSIAEFSVERYLQDMPYEILYEIFRSIHKSNLIEISKLSSKFRNIAGDRRLWKNVYITYEPNRKAQDVAFAFEELYSEPWPVKAIVFTHIKINSPVSSQTDQAVKVTKLFLSSITADEVTVKAILTKYQCTELYLSETCINCNDHVLRIKPEAFLKQTSLEVLSLRGLMLDPRCRYWLAAILSYCKNLKNLNLRYAYFSEVDIMCLVEILPTSLEKLFLGMNYSGDLFFKLLAKSTPNLRELGICPSGVKYPSLIKLRLLETLHIIWNFYYDVNLGDLHIYLKKFPALKTVYIVSDLSHKYLQEKDLEEFQRTLEPHGIIVRLIEEAKEGPSVNDNLWEVSKTL